MSLAIGAGDTREVGYTEDVVEIKCRRSALKVRGMSSPFSSEKETIS
jgi:hypothetical protein